MPSGCCQGLKRVLDVEPPLFPIGCGSWVLVPGGSWGVTWWVLARRGSRRGPKRGSKWGPKRGQKRVKNGQKRVFFADRFFSLFSRFLQFFGHFLTILPFLVIFGFFCSAAGLFWGRFWGPFWPVLGDFGRFWGFLSPYPYPEGFPCCCWGVLRGSFRGRVGDLLLAGPLFFVIFCLFSLLFFDVFFAVLWFAAFFGRFFLRGTMSGVEIFCRGRDRGCPDDVIP